MIRYRLNCTNGHEFEAWFRNSAAFDEQNEAAQIICPVCGSSDIEKALMTPSIPAKSNTGRSVEASEPTDTEVMATVVRKIREHVEANADYVGDKFAEEARKIHYEETEPRGIFGEATPEEASELRDEGVEVHPLPPAPEDKN